LRETEQAVRVPPAVPDELRPARHRGQHTLSLSTGAFILAAGGSLERLESVASFFVSRIDTEVDNRLEATIFSSEQMIEYMDMLLEKVDETWYPSGELLDRIDRMLRLAAVAA